MISQAGGSDNQLLNIASLYNSQDSCFASNMDVPLLLDKLRSVPSYVLQQHHQEVLSTLEEIKRLLDVRITDVRFNATDPWFSRERKSARLLALVRMKQLVQIPITRQSPTVSLEATTRKAIPTASLKATSLRASPDLKATTLKAIPTASLKATTLKAIPTASLKATTLKVISTASLNATSLRASPGLKATSLKARPGLKATSLKANPDLKATSLSAIEKNWLQWTNCSYH